MKPDGKHPPRRPWQCYGRWRRSWWSVSVWVSWQFEKLPISFKKLLNAHIAETQRELAMLRVRLTDPTASDSLQFAGFVSLLRLHEPHLVRDFTSDDEVFIRGTTDSLHLVVATEKVARLRRAVIEDSVTTNAMLLDRSVHSLAEHGKHFPPAGRGFIDSLIASLTAVVATYDSIMGSRDTVVIAEELERWRAYQSLDRLRDWLPRTRPLRAESRKSMTRCRAWLRSPLPISKPAGT